MLRERTKAGLDSARREGRIGGRRPKLTPQQQSEIRKMVSKGRKTAADAEGPLPPGDLFARTGQKSRFTRFGKTEGCHHRVALLDTVVPLTTDLDRAQLRLTA